MPQVFRPLDRQVVELADIHARQRGTVARPPAPGSDAGAYPRQASLQGRLKQGGACPGGGFHPVRGGLIHEAVSFQTESGAWLWPATDAAHDERGLYRFFASVGASVFRLFPAGCVA
jgi:hypothetical protein